MTAHELLIQLRTLNVRLFLEQGRLRVVEPAPNTLSDEIWNELQLSKEELRRVLQHATQTRRRTPIPQMRRPQEIPLSFAQQRLWFLAQMEGVSEVYHVPQGLRLSGELDRNALKRALDRIVWRHEALRTTFHSVTGQPVQRVQACDSGFALQEHDLSLSAEPQSELKRLARQEASNPFDLENAPLIRGRLIGLAAQEHVLLITMHHIVSDGWSLGVFIRELSTLYHVYHAGGEDPLPPLSIQYADYAIWQQQWLNGEELQQEREYWRRAQEGAPALLELPTDRPRPAQQVFDGDFLALQFDAKLTRELKGLAQRHEMTLYMVVLAAWAIVLSRLSGQEEVVIGTVSANRTRPELEGLIGFFVNTLPLRMEVSGNIAEMLQRAKAQTLDVQEHQELPFEQIVEIAKPPRSLTHTPIFQVMLAWQSNNQEIPKFTGLKLQPEPVSYAVAKFDLTLDLRETGDQIVGGVRFATALFSRGTIERHAGYLRRALEAMVADSQQAVTGIDLLSPEERRLLTSWNATEAPYPEHRCIHQLFEEQARKSPEAIAVVHEEQSLSYFELNQLSNRLAHQLIALGLKPDDRVAICVKRSLSMVVGMLAILKAGGAYVPLDPSYPSLRLLQILADASPEILLSDFSGRKSLGAKALESMMVVNLDELNLQEQPATDPDTEALRLKSHHLAYVIYTSGSTGTPKGVMIEHANATNVITWGAKVFSASETAHTLFSTSIQFDVSVFECFVPLACGATVHLVDDVLAMLHPRPAVSMMSTVPSAISALLDQRALLPSLRTINLGGEPLKKTLIEKVFEQSYATRVCNLYGPTETTTYSTWISMARDEQVRESIGRPIANTQIYLLDKNKQPVPVGAVGELYIGGAGVARGYLNRPELTAERFLPDPFSPDPKARMYKTGDLGRFREDGTIEYLGRNDFQVKIRGFRIELEEIEAALATYAGVHEAVVVAREDHSGDKRLVAYITANAATHDSALSVDIEALRSHMSSLLPGYMVPAVYVLLEKFPRTPNGKLDRKALPSPDNDAYAQRTYEAPVGEMEASLARLWRETLKLDRVGRHDNFFDLGGHSLLIVKLLSLLRQLGIHTTVAELFNHPTIESFAAFLSNMPTANSSRGVQRLREGALTPLFLVHDGGGNELYFSNLAKFLPGELPVYGLPSVPANEPQLHSMRAMAERMVHLIHEAQPEGPYRLAGWSFGGILAYEIAQLLLDQGDALEFLGLLDAWNIEGRSVENKRRRTPEAVLIELCEMEKKKRRSGPSTPPSNAPDTNSGFDALFDHYRAEKAIPDSFEHLAPDEARAECNKLEHHLQVMEAYRPQPIGIPVHLFVASERFAEQPASSASLGWERCVPEHLLHVHTVPGGHHSMMKPPHIKTLGQQVTKFLVTTVAVPDSLQVLHAGASD
ncbi:MAG TPA: amino acid adenylation domain-containing protein [Candidatus Angelobacter sp.]|nr:amino acid adenylation domain-containing protein [Candidatus Angelobacter sp.]